MPEKNVYVYVFDTMADWETGYAVAGINDPEHQKRPVRYGVRTAAAGKTPILTIGGMRILPDVTIDAIPPEDCAMLILPGGKAWNEGGNTEAVETARRFLDRGIPVAAICGATAGLARGGLLDGRRHTSNVREYLAYTGYRGAALYEEAPAVTDGDVITASGTAPLEFALHIFRRLDLYSPEILDAWYGLFKTGRMEYFEALVRAAK